MEYVDLPFPPRIALGAQRRPRWNTSIVQTANGAESANMNWTRTRHSFDVSFAVRTASDYAAIVEHFHGVRGRFRAFPFKDFLDFRVTTSQGVLTLDEAVTDPEYRMFKRYGAGPTAYERRITRPVLSTLAFFRFRSGNVDSVTAEATVDDSAGVVMFDEEAVEPGDVFSWSGEFVIPCRYDTDELPSVAINREPGAQGELLVQCESIPIVEVRDNA